MSRMPPTIEQVIDGIPVEGWQIQPIKQAGITYSLTKKRVTNIKNEPQGENYFVAAHEGEKLIWETRYANINYDYEGGEEIDVQEVYPVDFYIEGVDLVIKHENYIKNDRIYRVSLEDGSQKFKSL